MKYDITIKRLHYGPDYWGELVLFAVPKLE